MRILDEIVGAVTIGIFELGNSITATPSGGYTGSIFISQKGDPYYPDEVRKKLNDIYHSDTRDNIYRYSKVSENTIVGWRVAAHVCAYLSGKEGLHDDKWKREYKVAANVICNEFGIPGIYKGISTEGKTMKNYSMNSNIIILNSTVVEAMRRFPCEGYIKSIKEKEKQKHTSAQINTERKVEKVEPDEVINKDNSVIRLIEDGSVEKDHTRDVVDHPMNDQMEKMISSIVTKTVDEVLSKMVKEFMLSKTKEEPVEELVVDTEAQEEETVIEPDCNTVPPVQEEEKKSTLKSPIKKLDPDKEVIRQNSGALSSAQKKKFGDTFGKFLQGKSYQLNKVLGELIECAVYYKDENLTVTHIIDPGLMIGDEYYVVVPTVGDVFSTIKVHPSEVDILNKVFNSKYEKYRLTAEEHQRALSHMFLNQRIYSFFDMSNMGNTIRKLKTDIDKFKKFGQKLTCIINCIDNPQMCGRLTFSNFKNIDNFEVVSAHTKNHKVKSPFPGETLEELSGVKAIVKDDDITIVFQGQSKKYHIDRYDVM